MWKKEISNCHVENVTLMFKKKKKKSYWIKTFGGRFLHTPCIKAIKYQCKCDALLNVKKKLLNVGNMAKNNTPVKEFCVQSLHHTNRGSSINS